jgi:hypothetical protein
MSSESSSKLGGIDDPVMGRVNRLLSGLSNADDRGMTLQLCAFLDDVLGQLILTLLRDDPVSR